MGEVKFIPGTEPLLEEPSPYRYLVLAGGRGSGKSWSVARALLIRGCRERIRWLCCRELQNSIGESVHKLFETQIQALGLGAYFDVQRDGVYGKNGTEFFYKGIRNDPQAVKSTENLDGAWVEEGQSISAASWEALDPTVRRDGSQIIVTYNPRFATDTVHAMFVDPATRPARTWYKSLNYTDNPYFTEVNREQMEHMRRVNPLMYQHVWRGECVPSLTTALWSWESINANRVAPGKQPDLARIVVAVDPAVTAHKKSDETGIVVAGYAKGTPRHFYTLGDLSGRYSPEAWARKAVMAYDTFNADAIVCEVNQGGDLVPDTIRNYCRAEGRACPPIKTVRATRGKLVRAEPIAALYEQGLVHHVGGFAALEQQLLRYDPAAPDAKDRMSPDRLDATVWALTELSGGRTPIRIAAGMIEQITSGQGPRFGLQSR